MTKRNQIVLDLLIDCIIKTVLGWLRDVFRFVSIAELFAGLAKPAVGDLGEVNVEKSRTDHIQPVRIDGAQSVGLEGNTERKISPLSLAGLLWWLRTERGWGRSDTVKRLVINRTVLT